MTPLRGLPSLGRLGWALVGALAFYVAYPNRVVTYPEVVVPAARILEREVPAYPPTIRERIVYVYLTPDVRAVAPGGAVEDVARFCRPILVTRSDTVRTTEIGPSLIRTVSYAPPLWPLTRGSLLVTSMDGHGDLVAEDYRVRAPFGIAAGLEAPYHTIVRTPRLAPLREIATGVLWYGAFRALEAVVR